MGLKERAEQKFSIMRNISILNPLLCPTQWLGSGIMQSVNLISADLRFQPAFGVFFSPESSATSGRNLRRGSQLLRGLIQNGDNNSETFCIERPQRPECPRSAGIPNKLFPISFSLVGRAPGRGEGGTDPHLHPVSQSCGYRCRWAG